MSHEFAAELERFVSAHAALDALRAFNSHLPFASTDCREMFAACIRVFNHGIASGIVHLAGRLTDVLIPVRELDAHGIGAHILDAAVDEYGLRGTQTHKRLFEAFASDLCCGKPPPPALPAARRLGAELAAIYRTGEVPIALGAHVASEVTSHQEYRDWHVIFANLPSSDARLYLQVHTEKEPGHVRASWTAVRSYLEVFPEQQQLVRQGARQYLDSYADMFRELAAYVLEKDRARG